MASQLRAVQARVVRASVEARNIAYQLRPPELDLGLPIALRDLCNQFAERAPGIALEFAASVLPESVPLEVPSCVYRVAQESLYNKVTHSRAKHASVILTWRQGAIELTIADDGDGLDCQSVQGKGGLGLVGMEQRARLGEVWKGARSATRTATSQSRFRRGSSTGGRNRRPPRWKQRTGRGIAAG